MSIFSDSLNITLSGWTKADGTSLSVSDIAAITDYLSSNGFDTFVNGLIANNPASLAATEVGAANAIPIVYSGKGQNDAITEFEKRATLAGGRAYTISDTQRGTAIRLGSNQNKLSQFIDSLQNWAASSNSALGGKLQYNGADVGAKGLEDVLWNASSADYADNIIAKGIPARGFFGADANPNRGFGFFEWPKLSAANFKVNGVPASGNVVNFADLRWSQSFAAVEDALFAPLKAFAHDETSWWAYENNDKFKGIVDKANQFIADLAGAGIDMAGRSLADIERAMVRTFHASKAKMAEFADYAILRAQSLLELTAGAGAAVPELVEAGFKKARDYFKHPDGSINAKKLSFGVAAGVLAMASIWVEADKRGGFTTPAFQTYLHETLKDVAQSIVSPLGVALIAAQFTPLGPAINVALLGLATYETIRKVLDHVVDTYGQEPGFIRDYLGPVRSWFVAFEKDIQSFLNQIGKDVGALVEAVLENVTASAIEWRGGETATPITIGNEIVIG